MSKFFSSKYDKLKPYVPGEQPTERKYVKLNTNESPFPPSPIAQRLARQAAGDNQLYSDPEVKALVKVASEKLGVGEKNILFSNGSDEILNFACMAFCDDKTPMAFPSVTYSFYPVIADLNGVPSYVIPVNDDFTINVSDYIGINKTIFIANPNAPTGVTLPLNDIEKIVKGNPDNVVIIDEAYVDFGAESAVNLTKEYDNLLVMQTFSKSRSLAGARLGFAVGNEKLIQDLNTIKYSTNPYNVNRMTMYAGIGALEDDVYFKNNCLEIIRNREYLEGELKRLGFTMTPSLANFVFAKTEKIGGEELYLALKEKGILVRHFSSENLKEYNRITIGNKEQLETLVKALEEIL